MVRKAIILVIIALASFSPASALNRYMLFSSSDSITQLDFSTPPFSVNYKGKSQGSVGISHVEDNNGNIMIVANHNGVFDRNGDKMPGSDGIKIAKKATEVNISPYPGDPNKYYILYNEGACSPLYYSIVDMTMRNGLGDVSQLNVLLHGGQFAEGMEVVGVPCSYELWYITYGCNMGFVSFKIDTHGIFLYSLLQFYPLNNTSFNGAGELEYHNFKLGMSFNMTDSFMVADFNPYSCTMSNMVVRELPNGLGGPHRTPYGFEFSTDATKAYISRHATDNLYQYDILNDTLYSYNIDDWLGQMEIGPDGSLYITRENSDQIFYIKSPNAILPPIFKKHTNFNMSLGISDPVPPSVYPSAAASFSYVNTSSCLDLLMTFNPPADPTCSTYYWDFGDGTSSTLTNPTHQYQSSGSYTVALYSDCRCDTLIQTIDVSSPRHVDFNFTVTCPSVPTGFWDQTNCTPIKWAWDFGDGSPIDTNQAPDHKYALAGNYLVTLTNTWSDGLSLSASKTVPVLADTGNAAFDYNMCESPSGEAIVTFSDASLGNPKAWIWSFGNGAIDSLQNTSYTFDSINNHFVTLEVYYNNGCAADTVTKLLELTPVLFAFKPEVACPDMPVQFSADYDSAVANVDFWNWDFGDPSTTSDVSQAPDPTYTYDSAGNYVVSLTFMYNNFQCIESFQDTLNITSEIYADFKHSIACKGDEIQFSDASYYLPVAWLWDFGNGTIDSIAGPHFSFDSTGVFDVTLITTNECGYTDTIVKPVTVAEKPHPDFAFTNQVCANEVVAFNWMGSNDVTSWQWDFGDSTTASGATVNHAFPDSGTFQVTLMVQNAEGCINTNTHTVTLIAPFDAYAGPDTGVCPGTALELYAYGGEQYSWSSKQLGFIADEQFPSVYPEETDQYTVTVSIGNCDATDSVVVSVNQVPVASAGDDQLIYLGQQTMLEGSGGDNVLWEPQEGLSDPYSLNPMASPKETTTYTLFVFNQDSCYTMDEVTIEVSENETIDFPSAFTPNGDGKGDYIFPVLEGNMELVAYRVYNRWGELVFETNRVGHGWDGNFKGRPQPIETYVYYVLVNRGNGDEIPLQGNFVLIR